MFFTILSERVGWIPKPWTNSAGKQQKDLDKKKEVEKEAEEIENILGSYQLFYGLSVTEMEIVYGAFRIWNPNGK